MAKIKLANKKQILKIIGAYLILDGAFSIYFLGTGIDFAFLIRFIRILIGIYLIWLKR